MAPPTSYIIIGPPRSGKTILARKLASRLGASHIHADSLVSAFEIVFPHLGITHDAPTLSSICDAFEPWIFAFINSLLKFNCRFVLDSYHIRLSSLLQQDNILNNVTLIPIGYPRITASRKLSLVRQYTSENDWMRELGDNEALAFLDKSIQRSILLEEESKLAGILFLDLSSDFEDRITRFVEAQV